VDEKQNEIKNQVFLVALLFCCFVAAPAVHRQQKPESCCGVAVTIMKPGKGDRIGESSENPSIY